MSYISRDELEFIGQHWLDAVDAKASKLVAAQLEAMRTAEPTAAVDDVAPSMVVEPEAQTIEPEPEAEPEQPACVASIDDVNCPEIPEGCSVANCASEEQETAPELAYAVTDAPETVTEDPADELPTQRADIDDPQVLAALYAAFGLRDEYSFSESKFAHTWVADSFEQPAIITVPADVLTRAISLYRQHQGVELIDGSGCTESQIERLHAVSEEVLSGYSEWFIPVMRELIERVKENGLENVREMRIEMRLIAERLMREFFNPRSGAPSLGCSEDQIQGLCDVLWEVENGYFGPFEPSDLMPVFNQLVGYVRATKPDHARKMRLYLRSSTKINGNVIFPEQVNQ